MIANTLQSSTPGVWLLLRDPKKAAPLARKVMGTEYSGKLVKVDGEKRLKVADALLFRHRLALPNHGNLTALERMTMRGLLAIAEETTEP